MDNPTEAMRFLALLGKDPATCRLRFFAHKHNPRKQQIGARKLVGVNPDRIAQYQREGRGAYVAIGNSDGKGDEKKNIIAVPALFVEWDDKPVEWQLTAWKELHLPEPSIQVKTGGVSVQTYWVLDTPMAPQEWEQYQARLIRHSGSDPACSDASRVMRLPGCAYIGADGTPTGQCRIVGGNGQRYRASKILPGWLDQDEFSDEPEPPQAAAAPPAGGSASSTRDYPPRTLQEVREALKCIPAILPETDQRATFRKLIWSLLCAVREAGADDAMALALIEEHSPQVVDAADYLKTEPNKITSRSFWRMARDHGWRPARHGAEDHSDFPDDTDDDEHQAPRQQQRQPDPEQLTYTQLLAAALEATRSGQADQEMTLRAEIMARFRRSDAQITKALIDLLTSQEGGNVNRSTYGAVDLERTAGMDWQVEGFIPERDQVLIYGEAGAGKTTAAVGLAFAVIEGTGFLDRASRASQGSVLFIASDSGADPLKAALQSMGLIDHPALDPDAEHRLIVWAHDADQGRLAWDASLRGCIALLDFIRRERPALVIIDSAKAVTSKADLNYCDNAPVTALLTFAKEVLCAHCSIAWLHHDGTAKGSAAGAKAWKEIPSMVHAIEHVEMGGSGDDSGGGGPRNQPWKCERMRWWKVKKCRMGTARELQWELDEATGRPALIPAAAKTVVQDARAAIVDELWRAWQEGQRSLSRRELIDAMRDQHSYSSKTTDNNLSRMVRARHPEVCRLSIPRGHYKLAPRVVEVLAAAAAQTANPLNTSMLQGKEQAKKPVIDSEVMTSREVPEGTDGNSPDFPREKLGNSPPASGGNGSGPVPSREVFTPRARGASRQCLKSLWPDPWQQSG